MRTLKTSAAEALFSIEMIAAVNRCDTQMRCGAQTTAAISSMQ